MASDTAAGLRALGATIRSLRIERGIEPRGLALDAEISEDALARLEEGKTEPRWGTLRRIARGLDVDLAAVLRKAEELEAEMGKRGDGGRGR